MKFISNLLALVSFFIGYFLIDIAFRQRQIPFPFELFGVAAGAGLAFWAYGIFDFLRGIWEKRS